MRVMCINDSGWVSPRSLFWGLFKWDKNATGPSYADICIVTGEELFDNTTYYSLKEWPDGLFYADCFIPLTGEETESVSETIYEDETIEKIIQQKLF